MTLRILSLNKDGGFQELTPQGLASLLGVSAPPERRSMLEETLAATEPLKRTMTLIAQREGDDAGQGDAREMLCTCEFMEYSASQIDFITDLSDKYLGKDSKVPSAAELKYLLTENFKESLAKLLAGIGAVRK